MQAETHKAPPFRRKAGLWRPDFPLGRGRPSLNKGAPSSLQGPRDVIFAASQRQPLPDLNAAHPSIPEPLREGADKALAGLREDESLAPLLEQNELLTPLNRVLACSPFAARSLTRRPEILRDLLTEGRLARPLQEGELAQLASEALDERRQEPSFMRELRWFRHREMCRILWRDLNGLASLEESLGELTGLAEACILFALDFARGNVSARHGLPLTADGKLSEMAVIGMGKLGGGELNFSSDIDLIFIYSEDGRTDGPVEVDAVRFHTLVCQQLIRVLNQRTVDSFVYRVDTRLRPFGNSGPLVIKTSSLENYLARSARDWERYAWVKARVINPCEMSQALYEEVMRPFVYRRYLDYSVFESLRDMKGKIEREALRKDKVNDIKLGSGGIREIEFITQSMQLVRGGANPDLRGRSLREMLARLGERGFLGPGTSGELDRAYCFLRRLENRLQGMDDRQTQTLPDDEEGRIRLACAMGHSDWDSLADKTESHREAVARHFSTIVFRQDDLPEAEAGPPGDLAALWAGDTENAAEVLTAYGFSDPQVALDSMQTVRQASDYARMDQTGRKRLDMLIPRLIEAAAKEPEPGLTLARTLKVVASIARRSAYLALLYENGPARNRLVHVCGLGETLAKQLCSVPALADELLDSRITRQVMDLEQLEEELDFRLVRTANESEELRLAAINEFKQAAAFRVGVLDLAGGLPLMRVSDLLTGIAELVIDRSLEHVWEELAEQYGSPGFTVDGERSQAGFAVIAYGKLAGLEMGYGSDLDLVFVYDAQGEDQVTDGRTSIADSDFFFRVARRVISVLTTRSITGRMYEVDTRLRPSGRSGMLVSSLQALKKYQRESAWTWEHQALLRSRAIAGAAHVREAFEKLRISVLRESVRREDLRDRVIEMRQRMLAEAPRVGKGRFDIKHARGGLQDIEFIVQYLVLNHAHEHADLAAWPDNVRQLEALASHEVLTPEDADVLKRCYLEYREILHHRSLAELPPHAPADEVAGRVETVSGLWQRYLGA